MNPYRKRQRRQLQRERARPHLLIYDLETDLYARSRPTLFFQQFGRALRQSPIITVSTPVPDSWVLRRFKDAL